MPFGVKISTYFNQPASCEGEMYIKKRRNSRVREREREGERKRDSQRYKNYVQRGLRVGLYSVSIKSD